MKKKNIRVINKFSLQIIFIIGIVLLLYPTLKNTVTLIKMKTTTIMIESDKVSPTENEVIEWPTMGRYLATSPETIGKETGELLIPSQQIKTPLFIGLNNQQLLCEVGIMYSERNPKHVNMVVLGHHLGITDLLLGDIQYLDIGDEIFIQYYSDKYAYRVIKKNIVLETNLSVVNDTDKGKLTLITCDSPTITDKRVVIAELVEEKELPQQFIKHSEMINKVKTTIFMYYSILPLIFLV